MRPRPSSDRIEEMGAGLISLIDGHGYTTIVVGSGECSVPGRNCEPEPHTCADSLGVFEHDHPELVLFGLPLSHGSSLTDPVHAAAATGTPLAVGREQCHPLDCGATTSLVPVPQLGLRRDPGRIGCWLDLHGAANGLPPFVQICWAARAGSMSWEQSCASPPSNPSPQLIRCASRARHATAPATADGALDDHLLRRYRRTPRATGVHLFAAEPTEIRARTPESHDGHPI